VLRNKQGVQFMNAVRLNRTDLVRVVVDAVTQRKVDAVVLAALCANVLAVARAWKVLTVLVEGHLVHIAILVSDLGRWHAAISH
jgi:hypothetical protein